MPTIHVHVRTVTRTRVASVLFTLYSSYTYERAHIAPRGGPGSTRAEASCSHEAGRMAGRFPQLAASFPRQRTAARMRMRSGRERGGIILHRRRMHIHTSQRRGPGSRGGQRFTGSLTLQPDRPTISWQSARRLRGQSHARRTRRGDMSLC